VTKKLYISFIDGYIFPKVLEKKPLKPKCMKNILFLKLLLILNYSIKELGLDLIRV